MHIQIVYSCPDCFALGSVVFKRMYKDVKKKTKKKTVFFSIYFFTWPLYFYFNRSVHITVRCNDGAYSNTILEIM